MKLTTLMKAVPVALAMTGALGLSSNANASAYAVAYNNVFDIAISSNPFVPIPSFFAFSAFSQASANLDGTGSSGSKTAGGPADSPIRFGDLSTFAGAAPANNAMTAEGQAAGGRYAYADSQISTTALIQPIAGQAVTATGQLTQGWGIAEGFIPLDGAADADTRNSSETGFAVSFAVIGAPTAFTFSFKAAPYMLTQLTDALGTSSNAILSLNISISKAGTGTVFEWTPDGAAGGITGGTESADPFSLNTSVQVTSNSTDEYDPLGTGAPSGVINPANFGTFTATTALLGEGFYTISLDMQEAVNLSTTCCAPPPPPPPPPTDMPEPGVLALFGLGLAGLGFVRRRRTGHS